MSTFTDSLLDKQHIRKRLPPSPAKFSAGEHSGGNAFNGTRSRNSSRKAAFRPSGISALFEQNYRIIDGIEQRPVRSQRKQGASRRGSSFRFPSGEEHNENEIGKRSRERRSSSFSFQVIPVTAFLVLALGVSFVIYKQGGSLDWMDREVVKSGKDQGSQYNLALYAGVNPEENPAEKPAEKSEGTGDAIPLDLAETFAWQNYKVKSGDSVSKIAAAFSVSMDAIVASNGITNARALREGEVLRIPNMDGIPYTVKNGDSLSGISQTMGVPLEAILDANDIQSDKISAGATLFLPGARMNREDLKMALGDLFIYPLKGSRLSSPFGWRNDPFTGVRSYHGAVDLAAPQGTPVMAAMDGKVSTVGVNATFGNYIILTHSGGFQTMYAHLHTVLIKQGDQVRQGGQIGTVGTTGYSTGPHLHFAVYKNGRAVNPLDYLNSKK